jgi:hypothetical protein
MILNRQIKNFLSIIFLIVFLAISSTFVLALDEGFYSTISLSYQPIDKEGLTYNEYEIVGETTENVVRENTMDLLTTDGYKQRVYNRLERVSVPPFTKVDIGYYWYNNTPSTVNIEKVRVPLSREIQYRGDVTRLLYDIGFEEGTTYTDDICRGGKYIDFDGPGLISSNMYQDARKGIVLGTLTVKPSVEISKYEITDLGGKYFKLKIYVRNNTEEYLKNIWINYKGNVSKIIDLQSYEEQVLEVYKECEYNDEYINCGKMRIYDNNTRAHCWVYGSSWDNYLRPDSISLFNRIDNEWIKGAQTKPEVESFCIQRIPYRYWTEDMIVYKEPPPQIETHQYWENLLDIQVLPITKQNNYKIDGFLRLLKPLRIDNLKCYEITSNYTELCSKSSKISHR